MNLDLVERLSSDKSYTSNHKNYRGVSTIEFTYVHTGARYEKRVLCSFKTHNTLSFFAPNVLAEKQVFANRQARQVSRHLRIFSILPFGQNAKNLLVGVSPKPCRLGPTWPEAGALRAFVASCRYRSISLFFSTSVRPSKWSIFAFAAITSCISALAALYSL